MIGKTNPDCELRVADCGIEDESVSASGRCLPHLSSGGPLRLPFRNPQAIRDHKTRGFTLLELMIVISIIIILAAIAMPQYQKTVLLAKETVLRDDLYQMRKMIDTYAADKGKLPPSLQDLVEAGYMREIPIDPMTDRNDTWAVEMGSDPSSVDGGQGVSDVHSGSSDKSSEGTTYNEW